MSKNFRIPDAAKPKNPQRAYEMEDDAFDGLRIASNNNQPAMGMRYLVYLFDILDNKLTEIDNRLAELDAATKKTAPKAKVAGESE
jgi:hypothetical protein